MNRYSLLFPGGVSDEYEVPFDLAKKIIIGARVSEKLPTPSAESLEIRNSATLEKQHRMVLPGEFLRFNLSYLLTPNPILEIVWPSSFYEEIKFYLLERHLSYYLPIYNSSLHEWFYPYLTTNKKVILWPNEKIAKSIIKIAEEEVFL